MMNNEGTPVHRNAGGIENFRRWFGESKVVDETGHPLVVYHGTDRKFSEFDNKQLSSRTHDGAGQLGFYFSSNYKVALFFSEDGNTPNGVLSVYLSIQRPYVMSAKAFESSYADMDNDEAINFRLELIEQGYDGIFVQHDQKSSFVDSEGDTYIAFYPNQMKSACLNSGKFNLDSSCLFDDQPVCKLRVRP